MQISALTDIVEGKLLNSPSISFITQIHTNANKINDGDAYFATSQNQKNIQKAISKGVFAIISQFEPEITDNEIAWIKVDNITKAITNTLRYRLLKYKISFVHTDPVFFKLVEIFKTRDMNDIVLLSDNIYDDFEIINNIENDKVIFCTNEKILKAISANITKLDIPNYEINNLTKLSLFETTFSYKDKYFDKVKIPFIYLNHLIRLMELFDYKVDLKKLNHTELFEPIFINKSNQIVPFGQTNRFILSNTNSYIYEKEIEYLKSYYSYANIKILDTIGVDQEELYEQIKDETYNALYCIGKSINEIINLLHENDNIDKLF